MLKEFMDYLLGVVEGRYKAPLYNSLPPRFAALSKAYFEPKECFNY
jgi:hypothetical protein